MCRYYLGRILTQAGITSTKTQTQIQVIINCWSFAIAVVGSFMLDILGRRVQTFIGVGGMVVTLVMIGSLIKGNPIAMAFIVRKDIAEADISSQSTVKARIRPASTALLLSFSCFKASMPFPSHP